MITFVVPACSTKDVEDPGASGADSKDILTIDLVNEPSSLDPHMQWNPDSYYVYRNIFDNLVTRNDRNEIVANVATSWTYLSETEVEFSIRDDILFHDGSKLTPSDVAYSLKRITNPELGSPQLGQFSKISDAEVTGPSTVKLTTDGPYPVLLPQLVKLSIVPRHYVEEVGNDEFNLNPMGSGPYKFTDWRRGVSVTLERSDEYWGKHGDFPRVVFRAVPDSATRIADLRSGMADLVVSVDPDQAKQLSYAPDVRQLPVLTERVAYLRLNVDRPPLSDVRLRRAIAHAIDKQLIIDALLGGYSQPAEIMASPIHFGWVEDSDYLEYNPDKARQLIEEVGPEALQEIDFVISQVYDARIIQAIQQMLSDVGLNVSIKLLDMSTYLNVTRGVIDDRPDMSYGRWSCACQDADGVLYPLLHSSSQWSGTNDPVFDDFTEDGRRTLDKAERIKAYTKIHQRIAENVPLVPLFQMAIIYGASEQLQWAPTPSEDMYLNQMSWSQDNNR